MLDGVIDKLLKMVVEYLSPEFRRMLVDWILDLEKKAEETPSPYDNILVYLLKRLLAIDGS